MKSGLRALIFVLAVLLLGACAPTGEESSEGNQENTKNQPEEMSQMEKSEKDSPSISESFAQGAANSNNEAEEEIAPMIPTRVEIPAIGVDALIEEVGSLPNGQMDEPTEVDDVAWYEPGYHPGEQGSSVLAGHVDSKTGPSVFFDLNKLKEGDEIHVENDEGDTETFIVQKQQSYNRDEAPVEEIFGYSYRKQLNLITCTGEFNREAGTHDQRLVVYAVHEDDAEL